MANPDSSKSANVDFIRVKTVVANRGAMNAGVYIVKSLVNGKLYTEKTFKKEDIEKHNARREAEYLRECWHTHITYLKNIVFDELAEVIGKGPICYSVFLEYCSLGSLGDLILEHQKRGRKIGEVFAWHVFIQMADALRYLHHGPQPGDAHHAKILDDAKKPNTPPFTCKLTLRQVQSQSFSKKRSISSNKKRHDKEGRKPKKEPGQKKKKKKKKKKQKAKGKKPEKVKGRRRDESDSESESDEPSPSPGPSRRKGHGQICIEKRLDPRLITAGRAKLEVSALKELVACRYINRMIDWYIDYNLRQGSLFLEYCNYGSMEEYIEKSKQRQQMISEELIWKWFTNIAKALRYIHYGPKPENALMRSKHNTICHRDLKPGNIFLSRDEISGEIIAKLGDFGCATSKDLVWQGQQNARRASCGTPDFNPPEAPRFLTKSDVWQLGAVIVCLCNLSDCWKGPHSRRHGVVYTSKLSQAVGRCMESDIERRPKSDELVTYLQQAYNEVQASLQQPASSILGQPSRRGHRHWR
ncbi:kinase-like domain-containing protein [Lophiotrema nucula]|uniref:non-specific serine/threonine protein kinase n=1 Tax=Lophiotrema nucula TaxID=690887 RepID=A0A6A5ZPW5_9PLEO|nr:kinase-like domain-containing protein [Lophiotrema nucula]